MYTPTKISDSLNLIDAGRPAQKVNTISPHYPTVNPFNSSNTYLVLSHIGYSALYTSQGSYIKDLPLEILMNPGNPVWSITEPNILYFLSGNSVKKCDVTTNTITLVKQFPDYKKLTNFGEADISNGGDFIVLCGDDRVVFLMKLSNGLTSNIVGLEDNIESIYITPFTNVLISYHTNGLNRCNGVELFNAHLQFIKQVLPYNPHKDLMFDEYGEELLIHPNGNDPAPKLAQPFIIGTYLKDLKQRAIFKNTWEYSVHISCPNAFNKLKFFFLSRYDGPDGGIIKVNLDSTYEEICKHRSVRITGDDNYTYQPKMVCSGDGTKVVFSSNYGKVLPLNYCDTYLVNLPVQSISIPVIQWNKIDKRNLKVELNSDGTYEVYEKAN